MNLQHLSEAKTVKHKRKEAGSPESSVSPPCAPHTHPCLNLSPDYRSETPGFKYGYFGLPSPTCENKIKENIYPKEKPKEKINIRAIIFRSRRAGYSE